MGGPDYGRAARLAYKTLLALHIDSVPVEPFNILMRCRNAVLHTYDDIFARYNSSDYHSFKYFFMDARDAVTLRRTYGDEVVYEVFFDNRVHITRRRFTLAHELGHIILKHSSEEWWEEREADRYAAHLLVPRPVLDRLRVRGRLTPDTVARVFQVSRQAAAVALASRDDPIDPALYDAVARSLTVPEEAPNER